MFLNKINKRKPAVDAKSPSSSSSSSDLSDLINTDDTIDVDEDKKEESYSFKDLETNKKNDDDDQPKPKHTKYNDNDDSKEIEKLIEEDDFSRKKIFTDTDSTTNNEHEEKAKAKDMQLIPHGRPNEPDNPNDAIRNDPRYYANIDIDQDLIITHTTSAKGNVTVFATNLKLGDTKAVWYSPYARLESPMLWPFGSYQPYFPKANPILVTPFLNKTRYRISVSNKSWNKKTSKNGFDPDMEDYFAWLKRLDERFMNYLALNKVWIKGIDPAAKWRNIIYEGACKRKQENLQKQVDMVRQILASGGVLEDDNQLEVMKKTTRTVMSLGKNKKETKEQFPFDEFKNAFDKCTDTAARIELYNKYKDFFLCKINITKEDLTDDEIVYDTSLLYGRIVKDVDDKTTRQKKYEIVSVTSYVWSPINEYDKPKIENGDEELCASFRYHPWIAHLAKDAKNPVKYNLLPLEQHNGVQATFQESCNLPKDAVCLVWNTGVMFFDYPKTAFGLRIEPLRLRYYKTVPWEPTRADTTSNGLSPPIVAGGDNLPVNPPDALGMQLVESFDPNNLPMVNYDKFGKEQA